MGTTHILSGLYSCLLCVVSGRHSIALHISHDIPTMTSSILYYITYVCLLLQPLLWVSHKLTSFEPCRMSRLVVGRYGKHASKHPIEMGGGGGGEISPNTLLVQSVYLLHLCSHTQVLGFGSGRCSVWNGSLHLLAAPIISSFNDSLLDVLADHESGGHVPERGRFGSGHTLRTPRLSGERGRQPLSHRCILHTAQ